MNTEDVPKEKKGTDKAMLESLPLLTIKFPNPKLTECSICLESYVLDETLRTLPCLHMFHEECIGKWLSVNSSCPICKFDLRR